MVVCAYLFQGRIFLLKKDKMKKEKMKTKRKKKKAKMAHSFCPYTESDQTTPPIWPQRIYRLRSKRCIAHTRTHTQIDKWVDRQIDRLTIIIVVLRKWIKFIIVCSLFGSLSSHEDALVLPTSFVYLAFTQGGFWTRLKEICACAPEAKRWWTIWRPLRAPFKALQ